MSARNWVQDIPSQEAYALDKILFRVQHDRAEEVRFFRRSGAVHRSN